ncbi:hypothetical protein [Vulcanisaeta distributa]|uniref:hypothetical protein n=1 Tax=Vulcanisaeta distributa TaxID=164451 RepID=UPI0006D07377|nr:hypothetical protein [Vulcanisaeta distributa]
MIKPMEEYVGRIGISKELFREVTDALNDITRNEVYTLLNAQDLANTLLTILPQFTVKITQPLIKATQTIANSLSAGKLTVNELRSIEVRIGRELANGLRSTGHPQAEDLVQVLSTLIEHDLWVTEALSRYGYDGLIRRINERALNETTEETAYLMATLLTWHSATTATLNLIKEYKETNRDTLTKWAAAYAEELDTYIDTLDMLINDEAYETLKEERIIT